ncbi:MAG: hypothetical protein A3F68_00885 [Acidobacteria bacterium RIFCSPLOWO2_12_FULL_54_10]|nr:MAG: hypothetical protein A3F68_00885 [Acidobacteria bacterium RIFCSPLOWO2_12_FULL_54_10]
MNDFLPVIRDILRHFLSVSPMKGARLKPLVALEFERRTKTKFQNAFWMHVKFSDLLREVGDLVEIEVPSGPGDILVRLRVAEGAQPSITPASPYAALHPYIQPELWHAFNNPDTQRRRFYHRQTKEVLHFVDGQVSDLAYEKRVRADRDFVEIKPILGSQHSAWMKEFIRSQSIPETLQRSLQSIAEIPYSSSLNRTFTLALDRSADAWRRFRTGKVIDLIRKWAEENNVALPELIRVPPERVMRESIEAATASSVAAVAEMPEARKMLHAILDSLDDADLGQVLIPASLLAKIVGRRI